MLFSNLAIVAASLAGFAHALNYSTSGPLTIDPTQISASLKQSWCIGQRNSCPIICGGFASTNICSDSDLSYTCTCANGATPNITDYQSTIPSYVCSQWIANCVDNHPNDRDGIAACRSVVCGNKTVAYNTTSSSAGSATSAPVTLSSAASTAAATTAAATTTTTSHNAAATAFGIAKTYGTGLLAAGAMAAFGLAL